MQQWVQSRFLGRLSFPRCRRRGYPVALSIKGVSRQTHAPDVDSSPQGFPVNFRTMYPELGQCSEVPIVNQTLDKLASFCTCQDGRRDATILARTAANEVGCAILGREEFQISPQLSQ